MFVIYHHFYLGEEQGAKVPHPGIEEDGDIRSCFYSPAFLLNRTQGTAAFLNTPLKDTREGFHNSFRRC